MDRRITLTATYPRPWWRRLLGLPGKRVQRGPLSVEPWPKEWTEVASPEQGRGARGYELVNPDEED